jgi:two-component system response regulator YesN
MYKILIADDEGIVTDALKFIINKTYGDACSIEIAKNGRQAIHLAETFRPDILVIDIQMPGINGLDALKEIHAQNPQIRAIILTAYSNFDYAKEAIHLGAVEYMTKPLNRNLFTKHLSAIMHSIDAQRMKRENELEIQERMEAVSPIVENGFVLSLCFATTYQSDKEQYRQLLGINRDYGLMMVIDVRDPSASPAEGKLGAVEAVHEGYGRVREEIRMCFRAYVSELMGSRILCALPMEGPSLSYEERVDLIEKARRLVHALENAFHTSFRIGIGSVRSWRESSVSFEEALNALRHGRRSVTHIEDLIVPASVQENKQAALEQMVLDAVESGREPRVQQEAGAYASWLLRQADLTAARTSFLELYCAAARQVRQESGQAVDTQPALDAILGAADAETLRKVFLQAMTKLTGFVLIRQCESGGVIEKAKAWMQEHYADNIQLEDVAQVVGISPYYFSKLFKEQTQVNFIDYLTDLRMARARGLLAGGSLSIKEICAQCGYGDQNYFSRIFKKVTGMTPTEYRQTHQKEEVLF